MSRPQISIVTPVFNCAKTLRSAVGSILTQTFPDWELLILDDGSTDETLRMARMFKDPRIRVLSDGRGNLGLAARLNEGVASARGEFIARMDGDDISFPQRLERQFQILSASPEIDLLGCSMVLFDSNRVLLGVQRARTSHAAICGNSLRSCLLPHATWMGRTKWFRANPYDERLRRAEDRDLLLRTRRTSQFAGLDEVLYGYRVDSVSLRKNAAARREYLSALWSDARIHSQLFRGLLGVGAELGKLMVDTIALTTNSDRFLLSYRSRAISLPSIANERQHLLSLIESEASGGC